MLVIFPNWIQLEILYRKVQTLYESIWDLNRTSVINLGKKHLSL